MPGQGANHQKYLLLSLASSTITALAIVGLVIAALAHDWLLAVVAIVIAVGSTISTVTFVRLVRTNRREPTQ